MHKLSGLAALLLLSAPLVTAEAAATTAVKKRGAVYVSRSVDAENQKPLLKFTEHYSQHVECSINTYHLCDIVDSGRYSIDIQIPLSTYDITEFDGETAVLITLGDLTISATLGDDPGYRAGKREATLTFSTNRPSGQEDVYLTVTLKWNPNRLSASITGHSPQLWSAIVAERFLRARTGEINSTTDAMLHLGAITVEFDKVAVKGNVFTKKVFEGDEEFEVSTITLKGEGSSSTED
jgi:hypothetical protein